MATSGDLQQQEVSKAATQKAQQSSSGNMAADFGINKSLDELLTEERQKGKQPHHHHQGNSYKNHHRQDEGGRGGGRFHHHQGFGAGSGHASRGSVERDYRGNSRGYEEISGGQHHGGSGTNRFGGRGGHHRQHDEREVGGQRFPMQRDAYGKNVEGRRIFVSNLAFETQWKYLKDHMRQAGDVVRADIFEKPDGSSRGIGLVEFRTKQDAQKALYRLDATMLDGRKIYLKEDTEGHVFPPLQSKKEFGYNSMGRGSYGGGRRDFDDSNRGRGGHYRNQRSRSRSRSDSPQDRRGGYRSSRGRGARQDYEDGDRNSYRQRRQSSLSNQNNPERQASSPEAQRTLTIQKRVKRKESSSEGARQTYSIHIGNLPYTVDKDQLRGAFNEFGKILHASVNLDEHGKSRGFGVVEFEDKDDAQQAAQQMDKAIFNGRVVTVKFYDQQVGTE